MNPFEDRVILVILVVVVVVLVLVVHRGARPSRATTAGPSLAHRDPHRVHAPHATVVMVDDDVTRDRDDEGSTTTV